MSHPRGISRRQFARSAAAAAASLTIVPRHVLGGPGRTPPSDTLTKAVIGVGGMGRGHLRYPGSVLVPSATWTRSTWPRALEIAGPGVTGYTDFREVLERPDIDIVHIATPPHWHALISIAAAEAGKDIWCEKPMTRTIGEGRAVVEAVRADGPHLPDQHLVPLPRRLLRLRHATSRRSRRRSRAACSAGRSRRRSARPPASTGSSTGAASRSLPPEPVPPELDYDFWLGPAPYKPYHPHRVHGTFRGYWDYDGGGLGDMGQHYLDPVQYILDKDDDEPGRGRRPTPRSSTPTRAAAGAGSR